MKKTLMAFSIAAIMLTGCASIVSETNYPVAVNSTPDGANFVIKNKAGTAVVAGTTPQTVALPSSSGFFSGETYEVTFQKEGFSESTITLRSTVDGWYWGNILFGGVIGMLIVDPATGAMYSLPKTASADLQSSTAQATEGELRISTIDALSDIERANLEPLKN